MSPMDRHTKIHHITPAMERLQHNLQPLGHGCLELGCMTQCYMDQMPRALKYLKDNLTEDYGVCPAHLRGFANMKSLHPCTLTCLCP